MSEAVAKEHLKTITAALAADEEFIQDAIDKASFLTRSSLETALFEQRAIGGASQQPQHYTGAEFDHALKTFVKEFKAYRDNVHAKAEDISKYIRPDLTPDQIKTYVDSLLDIANEALNEVQLPTVDTAPPTPVKSNTGKILGVIALSVILFFVATED
jgi:signal transduction histidine kinase